MIVVIKVYLELLYKMKRIIRMLKFDHMEKTFECQFLFDLWVGLYKLLKS